MKSYFNLYFTKYNHKHNIETIYFGGGTPSLLSALQLESLISIINEYFNINDQTEISIELNPGTFDLTKLKIYKSLGVNRFSLGVQSFETKTLNLLNRGHSLDKVIESIDILSNLGVENISWDLLMNLPYENNYETLFLNSLPYLEKYRPNHLSIYSLILEPESVFAKKFGFKEDVFPMPSQDFSADQYIFIDQRLKELGYLHYEISSFAKSKKFICKHNQMYWTGNKPFFGFGLGSASLFNGLRITKPKTLKKYLNYVNMLENLIKKEDVLLDLEKNKDFIVEKEEGLDEIKVIFIGGLRRYEGVDINRFDKKLQIKLRNFCDKNEELIEVIEGKWMRLKGVKGFLLCDEMLARLFLEIEKLD